MKYVVVTIDVEPDCTPSWRYSSPLTFDGVRVGVVDRLQPLFARWGILPTYLINNVVLEDAASVEVFRSLSGTCELGTHLHCEFIGPDRKHSDYAGMKGEANQCFLDPEVELGKMRSITALFRKSFGFDPISFRAGRFSAGPNTIRCLAELGYKVDTSVTPHVNWDDPTRERPVDYRKAAEQPYFVKSGSYLEPDPDGTVLEVPVSITVRRKWLRRRELWLRPAFASLQEMMLVMRRYSQEYRENKHVVLNMMFHNVEVLPKLSPYTQTEQDVRGYLDTLAGFFKFCRDNGFQSVPLGRLHDIYEGRGLDRPVSV